MNTMSSGAGSFDLGRAAKYFIDMVRSGAGCVSFFKITAARHRSHLFFRTNASVPAQI